MKVLFTTLSIRARFPRTSYYSTVTRSNSEEAWVSGIHQQEAGAKKFLAEEKIDKIVIFGSNETYAHESDKELFRTELKKWAGQLDKMTKKEMDSLLALRFLIYRLADFVYGDSEKADREYAQAPEQHKTYMTYPHLKPLAEQDDIPVIFVPDRTAEGTDNLKALIDALKGTENEPNTLYMDMQGGERTKIYINNALLQLLSNQSDVYHTSLDRVVATQFNPFAIFENKIIDETNRYRIIELVSGMNAFLNYGKADLLMKYIKNLSRDTVLETDNNVSLLIDGISDMDNAITFCRLKESASGDKKNPDSETLHLFGAIKKLNKAISNIEDSFDRNKTSYVENFFDILTQGIKSDFGELLNADEEDITSLIEWCIRKKNYVTATAIAENDLPSYFVKHGILYYAKDDDELESAKDYFARKYQEISNRLRYTFSDINHYFIKSFLHDQNIYPKCKKTDREPNVNSAKKLREKIGNGNAESPLHLYTKADGNDMEMILAHYSFIAFNRNSLAHASNESSVQPEELKNALNTLVRLSKKYRNTSSPHLENNAITGR